MTTSSKRIIFEFFTTISFSSFNRILIKNAGKIIEINIKNKLRSVITNELKRIDKIRLNRIRNEPKILKNPSFLP
jgi:hypothetical protein